ncbi:MAG: hypothetical protein AB8B53_07615 [Flavobacteriales bacterium]
MNRFLTLVLLVLLLSACTPTSKNPSSPNQLDQAKQIADDLNKDVSLVTIVEQNHKKKAFINEENVSFDILLDFGGKTRMDGKITLSTDSRNGKIEQKDGNIILFNNGNVYCSRGMNGNSARFAAYTWSYFFMFPYKLSDKGTNWKTYENGSLKGQTYDAQKLTFDQGIGDAPEDWYIMYSDKDTYLINTAAYIVTADQSLEEAEKDPHAIEYCDYKEVAGIPVATTWRFWGWQADKGLTNQLGNAQISNIKFHTVENGFYSSTSDRGTLVPVN